MLQCQSNQVSRSVSQGVNGWCRDLLGYSLNLIGETCLSAQDQSSKFLIPQLRRYLSDAFEAALKGTQAFLGLLSEATHLPPLGKARDQSKPERPTSADSAHLLAASSSPLTVAATSRQRSMGAISSAAGSAAEPRFSQQASSSHGPYSISAAAADETEPFELDDIRRHNRERVQQARDEFGSGWTNRSEAYCRHFIKFVCSKHSPPTSTASHEERLRRTDDALSLKVCCCFCLILA